jgi:hypothetical protein
MLRGAVIRALVAPQARKARGDGRKEREAVPQKWQGARSKLAAVVKLQIDARRNKGSTFAQGASMFTRGAFQPRPWGLKPAASANCFGVTWA